MTTKNLYSAADICKELNITSYTLSNWYNWDKKRVNSGIIAESELPEPLRLTQERGKPRRWTYEMLLKLKEYQKNIVIGRNGIYGIYSNPYHKETKKYKKSLQNE